MSNEIFLKFLPFQSAVDNAFWAKLAEVKLNEYKLDDSRKDICGFYTNSDVEGLPCRHSVDYSAFVYSNKPPPLCFKSHGSLYIKNTVEDFKNVDYKKLLQSEADLIWTAIVSGDAITNPDLLVRFLLISFADLKKYVFHYWFAFPAFVHSPTSTLDSLGVHFLQIEKSKQFVDRLKSAIDQFSKEEGFLPGFFLIGYPEQQNDLSKLKIYQLKEFNNIYKNCCKIIFAMADPSTLSEYPGWPLRNFLMLICHHYAEKLNGVVDILCYRDRTVGGNRNIEHSIYLRLNIYLIIDRPIDTSGWEKNKKNNFGPRYVNLAKSMDPIKLAKSSVDLNLKLMRWRLMPSLKLEKIANTKCLLLGSGTLGCNIARNLLAWGVKNITLVDNGKVSFSNPIRQTLFEFSDCSLEGGRPKAIAAAERLQKIYPCVNAVGIELSIPMPGHHVQESSVIHVKNAVETLDSLIDSHDVIYLLMDTRESRWLPTLLAAVQNKLVINVALGFDSYLVIRHGLYNKSCSFESSTKLGCYFCNDVVAPGNSMHDRTLDQQCTVTRPGVSMIASAYAVELMVSLLQHPSGIFASPDLDPVRQHSQFGPVPHQIRGFLSHSKVFYPSTEAFSKCTSCSKPVIDAYTTDGFNFLLNVFNSSHHFLEDLTGLTLLHQQTANAEENVLEFSDSESI